MQKVLIALALGLAGAAHAASQQAALLVYQVWEPGLDPYLSRVLVTPRFVRMDEGEGTQDYTLYDREQGVMYNVSREDRSALVMNPPIADMALPADLKLEQTLQIDKLAPTIGGQQPQNLTLKANGTVCRELVTVPDVMTPAVDGLREFYGLLARIQAATLKAYPEGSQTPCDLAENVYAPLRGLSHGLPIQDRGERHSKSLVDYVPAFTVDSALFTIPKGYERTPMPGLNPDAGS